MAFWVFMFIISLLVPSIMMALGKIFLMKPPKTINSLYGYRTNMSMKNDDTWKFAHNYCGKLWFFTGIFTMPLPIIGMFACAGRDVETVSLVALTICIISTVILICTIIPVERSLRKTFDKNGNRIEKVDK